MPLNQWEIRKPAHIKSRRDRHKVLAKCIKSRRDRHKVVVIQNKRSLNQVLGSFLELRAMDSSHVRFEQGKSIGLFIKGSSDEQFVYWIAGSKYLTSVNKAPKVNGSNRRWFYFQFQKKRKKQRKENSAQA